MSWLRVPAHVGAGELTSAQLAPLAGVRMPDQRNRARRLELIIRELIESGTWPPGARIPSFHAIRALTGVCLTTVGKAFKPLITEGVVVRERGIGLFVPREKTS